MLCLIDSEKMEWISLEVDGARLAPFETKSSGQGGGDSPTCIPEAPSGPTAAVSTGSTGGGGTAADAASTSATAALPAGGVGLEELTRWLEGLTVGALVDAKDKTQAWYQVCAELLFHADVVGDAMLVAILPVLLLSVSVLIFFYPKLITNFCEPLRSSLGLHHGLPADTGTSDRGKCPPSCE